MDGSEFSRYAKAVTLIVLVAATLGALTVATTLHFVPVAANIQMGRSASDDLMGGFQSMSMYDIQAIYHCLKASCEAWLARR
jgi:hypothetical protein